MIGNPSRQNEKPITGKELADHFAVDVHSVRRWRYLGMPALVYNPKLIRYYLSECEEWLRNRKVKSGFPATKPNQTPAAA
jgi:hypothetical protein